MAGLAPRPKQVSDRRATDRRLSSEGVKAASTDEGPHASIEARREAPGPLRGRVVVGVSPGSGPKLGVKAVRGVARTKTCQLSGGGRIDGCP